MNNKKDKSTILDRQETYLIFKNRKTQIRRPVNPENCGLLAYNENQFVYDGVWYPTTPSGKVGTVDGIKCPLASPDDRLWVQETYSFSNYPLILLVKDIRVERLWDITEADIIAEGINPKHESRVLNYKDGSLFHEFITPKDRYLELWDSIYYNNYPCKSNPWVWVIDFEAIK